MADNSIFTSQQFINAASLNTLVSNVSGAADAFYKTTRYGGLAGPGAALFVANGLQVIVTLPNPFHVLFDDGTVAYAHGTTDGIDTQTYTVDFTPLVPTTGLPVFGYILVSHVTIHLNQYAVIGPPPGHPDYNPNFQPYLAYNTQTDSLAVTASLTPPDNLTTYEIARVSLSVGATGVGQLFTAYWQRQADKYHLQTYQLTGPELVPNTYHGKVLKLPMPSGGLFTLPPLSLANTEQYFLTTRDTRIVTIVQAATGDPFGPNFISGSFPNPMAKAPAIIITPGAAVSIAATDGRWQILSGEKFARATMFRAMFVSDMNFYIDAQAGNDLNNGLSLGSPWQTLQFGHDFVKYNFDLAGFDVFFNCNGNFTAGIASVGAWVGQRNAQSVSFNFTPTSTITLNDGTAFIARNFASYTINGTVTISALGTDPGAGFGVVSSNGSRIRINGAIFSSCSVGHIYVGQNSSSYIVGNYSIIAGAPSHMQLDPGGIMSTGTGLTDSIGSVSPYIVTINNSPSFGTAFAFSNGGSILFGSSTLTYTGAAVGTRFLVTNNGSILTGGSGPTYFPGSVPGSGTTYNSYQ